MAEDTDPWVLMNPWMKNTALDKNRPLTFKGSGMPWEDDAPSVFVTLKAQPFSDEFNIFFNPNLVKMRDESYRQHIITEMLGESSAIRQTVVTNNRSSGWGRSKGKYRRS